MFTWSPSAKPPSGGRFPTEGEAARRLEHLKERYDLGGLPKVCGPTEMAESLYVLDLLDRWMPPLQAGRCLDVGSKYGAYLPGLATWRPGWDAIEADAHRRYWNLRTRRAVGEAIAGALPDCRFLAGDVNDLSGPYVGITWLLPFVFPEPQEAWGLPMSYFRPLPTLQHVLGMLQPGGCLLVLNQGEEEAEEQGRLFEAAGAIAERMGPFSSPFSPFRKTRFGWRFRP